MIKNANMQAAFENLKIGDILVSCWGYSMVLYDFFQVVGKTAASVKIRELKKTQFSAEGFLRCNVKPIKNEFASDVLTRRPDKHGYIRGSNQSQFMRIDSFYKEDEAYTEDHAD